ncbi:putative short-chain dehydrogenase/reductase family 42E member 2 isoform X2 [Cebus imitator]|uniref:putative short-chain dehydrogenase/reductase family 42E member 2 isoform X2 n=1 Tax=Cebus imitator TaxID=2715852 RepID=UPI00080A0712|nr:putative short-chain dehydrogenase/reductase family 42E member 2 isoform X2 [Cebus imitator]
MKPNPPGSSPEACKPAGQGEKSCPVCQACGEVSGPRSDLRSESGPAPKPGAIPGPGLGPKAIPEPQTGSGAVPRPDTVSGTGPGLGPGPGSGSVPGPGARSVPALGARSVPAPGARSAPGLGAESAPGLGAESVPGPEAGSVPGPGAGSVPGPGAGLVPGPGAGSTPGLGAGSVPGVGAGSVPGPGSGSVPGLGAVSAPGVEHGSVPRPGAGSVPGVGLGSVPGPGAGSVPGLVLGSVPGPGAASAPGLGAGLAPGPASGSVPEPELGPGLRQGSGTGPKPRESTATPTPAPQQKTQAKPTKAARQKVLVTGGGGYLGFSLGSHLAKSGTSVILLDRRRPQWELSPETEFIQADVRDEEALYRAFEGVDCVFHVASYGMSGAEKLQKEQIESINVGGTKLVIDVCVRRRVPRLIYTSTVNVAFGGKPIEQGNEDSVPYFPLDEHIDHYSRTKAIADQLTLMANGTPLPGGGILRTCVLRPPGIYGPEEQRHLPRVAGHIKKRLFIFRFGDRKAQMNWVHVHNLVQAHVLAAKALTAAKGYVASGQAYYINDGESVNLFEWMAPLFEKLGYSQPWIQVPTSWVYLAAKQGTQHGLLI